MSCILHLSLSSIDWGDNGTCKTEALNSGADCNWISVIWKFEDMKSERAAQVFGSPFISFKGQAKQYPTTHHIASGLKTWTAGR